MFLFSSVKVFSTTGSEGLAKEVCENLQLRLPSQFRTGDSFLLSETTVKRFSNDNLQVQVENVRGHFVVIIHTQVPPVNDRLIELFALLDAVNNARPADVLLVFPYMPYARSDRKNQPRISTMGRRLPQILTTSFGIKRVILLDPHDSHIKHYFDPAADEISAIYLLVDYLEREVFTSQPKEDTVIVFSDAGAAKRFGKIAYLLKLPVAYIDKDRPDNTESPQFNGVIGEVRGKLCVLIDDEILTGGTAIGDVEKLVSEGAASVYMLAIHAVLAKEGMSGADMVEQLEQSSVERFIVTNSIPHQLSAEVTKFTVLSIAPLLAEAIKRAVLGESLTELHQLKNVTLYR